MSDIKMPFGFPEKKFQHLEDIEFCKRLPLNAIVSICIDYQSLQKEVEQLRELVLECYNVLPDKHPAEHDLIIRVKAKLNQSK